MDEKPEKLGDEEAYSPSEPSPASSKDVPADADAQEQPHSEKPFNSLIHEIAFVVVICCVQLFVQSSLAEGVAIVKYIQATFGSTDAETSWYTAAYSLTIGTFIMVAGRFGDIYGHKNMFILGTLWFGLWQLIGGFSVYSGQILFDICRSMQGLGASVMFPNATGLIGATYGDGQRKNMIMSLFGAMAPNGFLIGATFSSLLAEFQWWPWAYWVSSILCIPLMLVSYLAVPSSTNDTNGLKLLRTTSSRKSLKFLERVDAVGAATGIAGLILINFSINQGGIVGWQVPYTYSLLIVGFIAFGMFYYVETRISTNPLVPFRKLSFQSIFALTCMGVGWSSFGIWVWYWWQFMLELRHLSPLHATAFTATTGISGATAALITGFLMSRIPAGYIMLAAMCFFAIGNTLLATMPIDQIYWKNNFLSLMLTPWGMDLSFPSACIILSNAMPHEEQGNAASLVTTVQNYSIAIGLGFAGTIESQLMKQGKSMLETFRGVWYFGIGLDVLGIVVALSFVIIGSLRSQKNKSDQSQQQEEEEQPRDGRDSSPPRPKTGPSDYTSSSTATSALYFDEKKPPSINLAPVPSLSEDFLAEPRRAYVDGRESVLDREIRMALDPETNDTASTVSSAHTSGHYVLR